MVERIFTISTIIKCATSTFHRRLFLNCFHRLDIVYCRVIDEFCADVSRSPTKLIRTEWKFYWLEIKIKRNDEDANESSNYFRCNQNRKWEPRDISKVFPLFLYISRFFLLARRRCLVKMKLLDWERRQLAAVPRESIQKYIPASET